METAQAYQWAESTMLADTQLMAAATGGVWESYAPIGTVAPFVIFSQQSSIDILTMNAIRLWADILLQVKMIGPSSNYAALVTGADRIDALFGRIGPIALSVGGVLSCYREQTIAYSELINGASWNHLGGLYRIALQKS